LLQLLVLFLISFNIMIYFGVTTVLWLFVAGSTGLALLQALGVTSEVIAQDRVGAIGQDVHELSIVLSVGLLAVTGLAVGRDKRSLLIRIIFVFSAIVLIVGIVQTGSRGTAVALTIALLSFVFRKITGMFSWGKTAVAVAVLMALVGWVSLQSEAVRARWESTVSYGSLAGREDVYPRAIEMFLERPLVGWGPTYHLIELGRRLGDPFTDPHNLYLWILNEVGLLGAVPFFFVFWQCFRSAWRSRAGPQGILPMAMFLFLATVNLTGTWHDRKLTWVLLAYVLASGALSDLALYRRRRDYEIRVAAH
jgi:O-antigen ligase